MACRRGHGGLVARLLAAGADANAALPSGETALMAAARAGSLAAVNALLARGARVNAAEATRGQTALMWAVANRHPAVTRALLDHGADIGARTATRRRVYNMGRSRSAGSASRGIALEEVVEGGSTALLFAARSGDVESARLLLAAGADVDDTAADGNTALVVAAHGGHGSLAALLLRAGADPDAAPLGYTALHAAVLRGTPCATAASPTTTPRPACRSCARCSPTAPTPTRASPGARRCGAGATTSRSWTAGSARPPSGSRRTSSRRR